MNSIDERIKRELENESLHLDEILGEKDDVPDMFFKALKGNTGRDIKFVLAIVAINFVALLFCVWQFWFAGTVANQIFWGVWALLAGISMVSFELWAWMEVSRASSMRAITRLELVIRDKKTNSNSDKD